MSTLFQRLFSLEGKVALITGASGGIGSVLARALAEAGATVALHGTSAAKLESIARTIQERKVKSISLVADVENVADCQQLAVETHRRLGRLDILVNCAGTNRRQPLAEVTPGDFDHILAVNLRSAFFLSQAAHPIMRDQGGGKIINIGSVTSTDGLGGVGVYGASKAALAQLTKTMALEWAADNIQVNCLAPGFMMTPLTEVGLWGDPHRKRWLLERVPAGRPGLPEDLVGAALLLTSPSSDYLTGHTLNVDGGYLAGGSWLKNDGESHLSG